MRPSEADDRKANNSHIKVSINMLAGAIWSANIVNRHLICVHQATAIQPPIITSGQLTKCRLNAQLNKNTHPMALVWGYFGRAARIHNVCKMFPNFIKISEKTACCAGNWNKSWCTNNRLLCHLSLDRCSVSACLGERSRRNIFRWMISSSALWNLCNVLIKIHFNFQHFLILLFSNFFQQTRENFAKRIDICANRKTVFFLVSTIFLRFKHSLQIEYHLS